MNKKQFNANIAYLEENEVVVSDYRAWDEYPYSRELFFSTPCGGDFSICVEEVTRSMVLKNLHYYDVSEATSMWWDSEKSPFNNIGALYEDIEQWKDDFIKIAEDMPY